MSYSSSPSPSSSSLTSPNHHQRRHRNNNRHRQYQYNNNSNSNNINNTTTRRTTLPNSNYSTTTTAISPVPVAPVVAEVPYFVLHLADGKAKALFTVPTRMAQSLIVHPILCRGASFLLEIDVVSQGGRKQKQSQSLSSSSSLLSSSVSTSSFLSTEFYSPNPEETAEAISKRIAIRMGGPSPVMSQFLGMR